jgi:hypothetical protein
MLAAVVVALMEATPSELAALAVVEPVEIPGLLLQLREPLTQVVAVAAHTVCQMEWLATAAPALSSSSTTSALPRSLPSSHRRSGLHQRVR